MQRLVSSFALIVGLGAILGACHPRDQSEKAGQQSGQTVQTDEGRKHGGHGLRRVCADDIAKFCQNQDKKRRCLRENLDKLSPDCKSAVEAARNHKRGHDDSGDNND
jgi:hypothetical protein